MLFSARVSWCERRSAAAAAAATAVAAAATVAAAAGRMSAARRQRTQNRQPRPWSSRGSIHATSAAQETRKETAEAVKAELEAEFASLELKKRKDDIARHDADDAENHVYRFSGEVSRSTCLQCMRKLTEWSRIDPKCDIE